MHEIAIAGLALGAGAGNVVEDLNQLLQMLFHGCGGDQEVINITENHNSRFLGDAFQKESHQSLEGCCCNTETKRHSGPLIKSSIGREGSFWSITVLHHYLPEAGAKVKRGEVSG